jgi:hypothetical protein
MERAGPRDLNYLFFRQQVERIRAETAASDAARQAHEGLAEAYEEQIEDSTAETFTLAANETHQSDAQP